MIASLLVGVVKLLAGPSVRWAGCAPERRQRIYFANHTSHLDAIVLWSSLPSDVRARTRPVAARDYWTKDRLRLYLSKEVFNAVLIERQKVSAENNPLEALLKALDEDSSLIIFPEGTRGAGEEIQPFKSGLYHLARKRPAVELVPVHIDNMNRILPKGEVLAVPLLSCITFGAPLRLADDEAKPAFLERARTALAGLKLA
jgi:1-acyl-sn-glycerol-3-phosphate acyltransferase